MVQIGDIVMINRRTGKWTVLGRHVHGVPAGRLWRLRRQEGDLPPTDLIAGDGDLDFVEHPLFTPSQAVRFDQAFDGVATVVADNGATLRLRYTRQRKRILSGEKFGSVSFQFDESDVARGELVAQQLG
jgi:hypothetical protein